MQSKGVIRLFAILFALACLWVLSFTWVSNSVQSDAEAYANGDPAKETAYLDSMSNQTVYDLGFTDYTYSEVKDKELNLG
ncbi:MAG: hypothetical protein LPK47_00795, partial [Bacteroidota bacterium]|nr:hypothetical protein [Bacteroidota bacterium]